MLTGHWLYRMKQNLLKDYCVRRYQRHGKNQYYQQQHIVYYQGQIIVMTISEQTLSVTV